MKSKLRILVVGTLGAVPYQGGWAWVIFQYLLGFRQLGHEVVFYEPVEERVLRPEGSTLQRSFNAAYFQSMVSEVGFEGSAVMVLQGTRCSVGLSYEELTRAVDGTDVLVNVSGTLHDLDLASSIPIRIYLDLDPGFTQLWQAEQGIDLHLSGHTHFATIGLAIGRDDCDVPMCGQEWITTVQPIALRHWPVGEDVCFDGLTTVANWRSYGSIERKGVLYGQKVHSLRQFMTLPQRAPEAFMLALAIHPDDRDDLEALRMNGWQLLDPQQVVATPSDYQSFVRGSRAEFGVAKSGYVVSRCGWFSDRSICYLAAGRPVIAQDTGFSRFLPTGEGLLSFESEDDVLASIAGIRSDYQRHRRAARDIAESYFDSDRVLMTLLRKTGATG